jgi:HlyD family secretion protein
MKIRLTKSRIIVAATILAVVGGIGYLMRPKPMEVDTAVVAERPMESVVEAYGRTRVRERYMIVAPVTGRVHRIERAEGDLVRAGDVVARLAPAPLDGEALAQAQARVDAARAIELQAAGQARAAHAALDQRVRERGRVARLLEAGGVAPRVFEEAVLATIDAEEMARGADARVTAAQADVRQARAVLDARANGTAQPVVVRAPASGRVLRIAERSERIIAAGTPLMEIGDPGSLEVVADLLSSDVATVRPGDRVRFVDWSVNGTSEGVSTVTGRVRTIEPAGFTKISALGIEEQRVNVIADLDQVPRGIGDGFRVNVAIIVWTSPSALTIPRSALLPGTGSGSWTAFVIRGASVEQRQVRIGHLGGADAEVLEGVTRGEQVVVFPSDRVKPGARVAPRAL